MASTGITIWEGSREFIDTTALDNATTPPTVLQAYDVAVVPLGAPVSTAVWGPVQTYAGGLGVWAEDTLSPGTYAIFVRVGAGAPNERTIALLGVFTVRGR